MSKIKHYQINIESVIGVNVDGLNFVVKFLTILDYTYLNQAKKWESFKNCST